MALVPRAPRVVRAHHVRGSYQRERLGASRARGVDEGLVLAGGAGTRLRPLTHTGAKQLVPVANRPVLFYVIDNLVDAGITDIGVIISPETGDEIRAALGDGVALGRDVHVHPAGPPARARARGAPPRGRSSATSTSCMYLGDNLIGTRIRDAVDELPSATRARRLGHAERGPEPVGVRRRRGRRRRQRRRAWSRSPKSRRPTSRSSASTCSGRPSSTPSRRSSRPPRGELEITDAISKLIELGGTVQFTRLTSWWLDTGKKDDLLLANDTVLDDWLDGGIEGDVDAESQVVGPRAHRQGRAGRALGHPRAGHHRRRRRASSTRASVRSPRIGDGVKIVRSTVEHSVIMEESRITDIPRLEDSLIGKRVVVQPRRLAHGALSLMVGDDCVVELSQD